MLLTKEQLTDAYEQGLSINTRNGNIKIVCILGDVYGVNHFNSNQVKFWMFENFERNQATIEQPKPNIDLSILKEGEIYFAKTNNSQIVFKYKAIDTEIHSYAMYFINYHTTFTNCNMCDVYNITELRLPTESELELFYSKFPELKPKPKYNGRAVKCDNLEQLTYICKSTNEWHKYNPDPHFNHGYNCFSLTNKACQKEDYYKKHNYEIISFSQYCTENGITEPKWIQGFEVGKDYKDVVMVSDDNKVWYIDILNSVSIDGHFNCTGGEWVYCRYPRKEEINEIKFSN